MKQIQPYEDRINNNKFQIEQSNSTINLIGQKFDKLNADINTLNYKKSELEKALGDKIQLSEQVEQKISQLDESLKTGRMELAKATSDLETKYKNTQTLLSKLSEIKVTVQERSQKNNILDALLKAQNEGKLSGIYGRLGDLGVIDSKYDIAVTTACSNLDSIVVETVDHAQKCLDFLKKNNVGRATFLILEKIAWVESKMKENFKIPNNCERLFDIVKYKNQRLAVAFYFALRDTLVAPDLKTATQVAYGSVRNRVVTLNGELIEISGTMSGGGKPKRGGMSNKDIPEDYTQEHVNILNAQYENLIKEFEASKIEKQGIETRCNTLNAQLQEFLILRNKTDNEKTSLENALEEVVRNLTSLQKEFSKNKKDLNKLEELKKSNEELEKTNIQLMDESAQLRNELNEIEIEIGKIGGDEFTKKKEELKQLKKSIDNLEKEINNMRNLTENAPEILEKIREEILQKEKVIKNFEDLIETIKKELEDLEAQGMELFAQIDLIQTEITNFETKFSEKSKELEELKVLIKRMREEQEKLNNEKNEISSEIKKLEKNEKLINEDLNKNKKSFKKLVDEFGFIDEFEKEIKSINNQSAKKNKNNEDGMMIDLEEKNQNENYNENEDEQVENHNKDKKRKTTNHYAKYIDSKYMEYAFKFEELDELSKHTVLIIFYFTLYYIERSSL